MCQLRFDLDGQFKSIFYRLSHHLAKCASSQNSFAPIIFLQGFAAIIAFDKFCCNNCFRQVLLRKSLFPSFAAKIARQQDTRTPGAYLQGALEAASEALRQMKFSLRRQHSRQNQPGTKTSLPIASASVKSRHYETSNMEILVHNGLQSTFQVGFSGLSKVLRIVEMFGMCTCETRLVSVDKYGLCGVWRVGACREM